MFLLRAARSPSLWSFQCCKTISSCSSSPFQDFKTWLFISSGTKGMRLKMAPSTPSFFLTYPHRSVNNLMKNRLCQLSVFIGRDFLRHQSWRMRFDKNNRCGPMFVSAFKKHVHFQKRISIWLAAGLVDVLPEVNHLLSCWWRLTRPKQSAVHGCYHVVIVPYLWLLAYIDALTCEVFLSH